MDLNQRGRPSSAWKHRENLDLHPFITYLCGGFIQLGPDRISLARHVEFGEKGEGLLQLLSLGLLVALLAC